MKNLKFDKLLPYYYCVVISFVALLMLSYSTSPVYDTPSILDSGFFQTIGKYWAKGYLPYVDLWDSKGPMIFFINCLGYMLTGTKTGVFILQFVSLSITSILIYRILSRGLQPVWSCVFLTIILICIWDMNMEGNGVEEYLLPLLTWAYFLMYKWGNAVVSNGVRTHPAKYSVVYGMVLAFCLLTRLTNALGLCATAGVIGIWLMVKGSWKNLFLNIIGFLCGFAVWFVPFALYFWARGAFDEMMYGMLLYNMEYAGMSLVDYKSLTHLLKFFVSYGCPIFAFVASIVVLLSTRKRKLPVFILLVSIFVPMVWFTTGAGWADYAIICIPSFALAILELCTLYEENHSVLLKRTSVILTSLYALGLIAWGGHNYYLFTTMYLQEADLAPTLNILRGLPDGYKKFFIGYNVCNGTYVYTDTKPCYRFFLMQDWACRMGASLEAKVKEEFKGDAQWILVKNHADVIADELKERYSVYRKDTVNKLTLYYLNVSK